MYVVYIRAYYVQLIAFVYWDVSKYVYSIDTRKPTQIKYQSMQYFLIHYSRSCSCKSQRKP